MTTITRKFTKEQLIKRLEEQESSARYALSFVQDSEILRDIEMDLRITEIALASLGAGSDSHPTHGPLSNYRLHRISDILSKAAAQSDGGNIGYAMSDAVKVIDELLEGRAAEPAPLTVQCWSCRDEIEVSAIGDCDGYCPKCNSPIDLDEEPYTTPPAAVVPDRLFEKWWESENGAAPRTGWDSLRTTDGYCDDGIDGQFDAWNASRAAMLNGGKS
ncbi:hypothetical protein [Citrobacter koseri]|uniref:hypothetical protein n=1 Tax=Citrobacter koseri TaxID=545 RepID=UPI001D95B342|nr:hypothetical protein [Citrobacter koseri]CAG0243703.1 hypothetical protein AN2353V1_1725 [Citrobacter koseri]CAH6035521.1 hypothetical protein AN2353V1_1725 [Citrobacter koseri]